MKSHNLPQKVTEAAPWYKKFSMRYFFTRYELLEKNNFPIWTELNAACLALFIIGCLLWHLGGDDDNNDDDDDNNDDTTIVVVYKALSIGMIAGSGIVFVMMTYVFVAPTICRIRIIRRWYLLFVEYGICQLLANKEYITGTNWLGYLPHLTARKMIDHRYVTADEFETVSSLAIVRNPYTRMVSIYMFNRFGPCEPFSHFVRSWYRHTIKDYRDRGEMEDWYTPCHAIPQFEYTHDRNGTRQLVRSVVKQEELKYLKTISSSIAAGTTATTPMDRYRDSVEVDTSNKMQVDDHDTNTNSHDNDNEDVPLTCTKSNSICGTTNETMENSNDICTKSSSISSRSSSSVSSDDCSSEEGLTGTTNTTNDFESVRSLPDTIRQSLLGMPHDNKRYTKTPWYDYYDQETLNLTYEMYHRDFDIFGYDVVLRQRPDLERPPEVVNDISV